MQTIEPSTIIGLEDSFYFLLAAYQKAQEEDVAEQGEVLKSDSKIAENEVFLGSIIALDNSFSEKDNSNIKNDKADDLEDKITEKNQPTSEARI